MGKTSNILFFTIFKIHWIYYSIMFYTALIQNIVILCKHNTSLRKGFHGEI